METFKNYEVVGITDREQCECCGKTGLKRTVAMRLIGTEIVSHFGVICAAAAAKYSTLEMAADAKKEVKEAISEFEKAERKKARKAKKAAEKAAQKAAEVEEKARIEEQARSERYNNRCAFRMQFFNEVAANYDLTNEETEKAVNTFHSILEDASYAQMALWEKERYALTCKNIAKSRIEWVIRKRG